jgi:hypothetical protein
VVTYLELYKNTNNQEYRMIVTADKSQKGGKEDLKVSMLEEVGVTEFSVFQLDSHMQIKNKAFEFELDFSAKYQSALPFGAVLFNEKGRFCIIELNSSLGKS